MDDDAIDALRQDVRRLIARLRHPVGRCADLGTASALDDAQRALHDALRALSRAYHRSSIEATERVRALAE